MRSPKMFSIFINDLIKYLETKFNRGIFVTTDIPELLTLMFAGDSAGFSDSVIGLQRLINEIETFCKSDGIEINLDKTKIIVFRNEGPLKQTERWFFNKKIYRSSIIGLFLTPTLMDTYLLGVFAYK